MDQNNIQFCFLPFCLFSICLFVRLTRMSSWFEKYNFATLHKNYESLIISMLGYKNLRTYNDQCIAAAAAYCCCKELLRDVPYFLDGSIPICSKLFTELKQYIHTSFHFWNIRTIKKKLMNYFFLFILCNFNWWNVNAFCFLFPYHLPNYHVFH